MTARWSSSWTNALTEFARQYSDQLLRSLVAAPSINPPGNENLAAQKLADFLEGFGITCGWQYIEPDRPNLLAAAGPSGDVPCLALCSHLDVVAPGDHAAWSGEPFVPRRVADRIYGRGSCDAKGSLTAMALVLAFFAEQSDLLSGQLVLAAVAGEEKGGLGSKFLIKSGFRADGAIIGEPTNLQIALGHKGRIQADVTVHGKAGHAAQPKDAINPIDSLGTTLEALGALSQRVSRRQHPLVGSASLVVTQIESGSTNAATIPAKVVLTLDRRLLPDETHESAAAEVQDALAHLEQVQVRWQPGAYPAVQDKSHPLVSAARASTDHSGAPIAQFPATCDQYVWVGAGIPSIILGPGDIVLNHVHGTDEYIALADIVQATLIYARTALLFLNPSTAGKRDSS